MQHTDVQPDTGRDQATVDSTPLVQPISEVVDASAGGKAYGLARLTAMGLAVPPALVLRNASASEFPEEL
ncbi:MAG: hypothetical protein KDI09_17110, partial [Halioglobus sp.]|nr:hypothetical protein [Halioglobus sp.]